MRITVGWLRLLEHPSEKVHTAFNSHTSRQLANWMTWCKRAKFRQGEPGRSKSQAAGLGWGLGSLWMKGSDGGGSGRSV